MSPLTRAVRDAVRLVAGGMAVIGLLGIGLEFTRYELKKTDLDILNCVLWALPIVLSVILIIKSTAVARRLTNDFDDEP